MPDCLAAAIDYLGRGYSVIPVSPGSKSPPLIKWEPYQAKRATEQEIVAWWRKWPNANVGIVTGEISDLTIIDADGAEGAASATGITGLPPTRSVKTPKGYHLYYRHNPAFHTGTAFLPGIDARNDGGYVVAPPSVVDNKLYTVLKDLPVATLTFTPAEFQVRHRDSAGPPIEEQPKWVRLALSRGAVEKTRNSTATSLAGYFHSKGVPPDIIRELLQPFAARCQPPMDTREIDTIVGSVGKYPTQVQDGELVPIPAPEMQAWPGLHLFEWPLLGVRLRFSHLREHSDATTCELGCEDIRNGNPKHIYGGVSFNLTSLRARSEMAKQLEKRRPGLDWVEILEQACPSSLAEFRRGEPSVEMEDVEMPGPREWVLWPIIAKGHTTVIYGPGGTGKSTLAQCFALCIELGIPKVGLQPAGKGKVLYLDWENSEEECKRTLIGLGLGLNFQRPTFRYRRCYRSLPDEIEAIQQIATENEITVVIVDGATYAAGGEKAAKENASPVFIALRSLNTSNLIIHHEAKDEMTRTKTAYGSVFWREWARHVFEAKASLDDGGVDLALFNTKSNLGPRFHPLGFRLDWEGDAITIKNQDVRDMPELAASVSLPSRIMHYLGQHGKAASFEISTDLQADNQQVRNWLSKAGKTGKIIQVGDDWALPTSPSGAL